MAKKKGSEARRAKKKHEKAIKRKQAVARRPTPPARYEPSQLRAPRPREPEFDWAPLLDGIDGLMEAEDLESYYEAAELAEVMRRSRPPHPPWASKLWTLPRVEALTTQQILDGLALLEIQTNPLAFLDAARPFFSAVEMARALWLPQLEASAHPFDRDFALLAAIELWARWSNDKPSQEALLGELSAGYHASYRDDPWHATAAWLSFWEQLRPRLTPEMRTAEAAGELLGGYRYSLDMWTIDFSEDAREAVLAAPERAAAVAPVLEQILAAFPDEEEDWRALLSEDLAFALRLAGNRERAEALMRELIAMYPRRAGGYVELSHLLAPADCEDRDALRSALAVLEQAALLPVRDGEEYGLDERIGELRGRLSVGPGAAA